MRKKNDYMVEASDKKLLIEIEEFNQEKEERIRKIADLIERNVRAKTASLVDALIAERKRQGLTQQNIADKIGVASSNIARFELKQTIPTFQFLDKYAFAVGKKVECTVCEL